jgi:hypothetical protein
MGTGNEEAQLQELSTRITEMQVTEDAMQEVTKRSFLAVYIYK